MLIQVEIFTLKNDKIEFELGEKRGNFCAKVTDSFSLFINLLSRPVIQENYKRFDRGILKLSKKHVISSHFLKHSGIVDQKAQLSV